MPCELRRGGAQGEDSEGECKYNFTPAMDSQSDVTQHSTRGSVETFLYPMSGICSLKSHFFALSL